MKRVLVLLSVMSTALYGSAQQKDPIKKDTVDRFNTVMPEVTVVGRNSTSDIHQMPEIVGTSIYAGKKSSLVVMDNVKGNVATNTMRQIIAKVPGIHVWESDGSGIQIGISARGLSPNRSWEFNVRQNGYDIAADPFGYPEAYYNPQLQAVQRVEIIRGQGALQYGPQFGGMVNYILRNGSEIKKPFEFETQQTVGSFGLINSYNAIGGQQGKVHYYAFFDHRNANGWRENSAYYTNAGFGTVTYKFTSKFSLTAEFMQSHIRSQQPGGLTDAQFTANARQSFRSRNWIDIKWNTAALIANYQITDKQKLNVKLFGVAGDRNSVGFVRAITIMDTIVASTKQYNSRTVDIDQYRNLGLEARYLNLYTLFGRQAAFSAGLRAYEGKTDRFRDGVGTTGTNYDLTRVDGKWPRDLDFLSKNAALFVEQSFSPVKNLLIIPGIRYEYLWAKASGITSYTSAGDPVYLQNLEKGRSFFLAGIGAEYHVNSFSEIYGNITQSYRPIQFADLTAAPTTDVVDPNMKDASGYNIDLGYRGKWHDAIFFDVSAYYLQYNNRVGSITQQRTDGTFYNYRTNVGNSVSKGIESLVEWNPFKTFSAKARKFDASLFVSYGFTEARYGNFKVVTKNSANQLVETNLKDKFVENAPQHIVRTGVTLQYTKFSLTTQWSHVSGSFADANNTVTPTANGQAGYIPSYTVVDITAVIKWNNSLNLKAGVNNATDARYFTRRAGGYPGPGLLPSDGRNVFLSITAKL